jgi:hypothetical protein
MQGRAQHSGAMRGWAVGYGVVSGGANASSRSLCA